MLLSRVIEWKAQKKLMPFDDYWTLLYKSEIQSTIKIQIQKEPLAVTMTDVPLRLRKYVPLCDAGLIKIRR